MKDPLSLYTWTMVNREMQRGTGLCSKDKAIFQATSSLLFRLTQNGSA
jgi:hypothetical protein